MVVLPEMPSEIAALPRDERGYPIPVFVARIDGKPEFRVADGKYVAKAIKKQLCWVCGQKLDPKIQAFVLGPMCTVNRISSEPPSHPACAEFSVQACPFLSKPKAVRREAGFPEGTVVTGMMIERNPGVCCIWYGRGCELLDSGNGGILFGIPNPSMVRWYAEGRKATREEIVESINAGFPILEEEAAKKGKKFVEALHRDLYAAMKFVPASVL